MQPLQSGQTATAIDILARESRTKMCLIGLPPGHHRLPSRGSSGGHVGGPSTVATAAAAPPTFPPVLSPATPPPPLQGMVQRKRATRNSKTKGNYSHGIIEQCHARQAV